MIAWSRRGRVVESAVPAKLISFLVPFSSVKASATFAVLPTPFLTSKTWLRFKEGLETESTFKRFMDEVLAVPIVVSGLKANKNSFGLKACPSNAIIYLLSFVCFLIVLQDKV